MLAQQLKHLGSMMMGKHLSMEFAINLVTYLIVIALLLLVGKFLWNDVLVKLTTVVKPVTSIWQLLGLQILFSLLFC